MSGSELSRRTSRVPVSRNTKKELRAISDATLTERGAIRAVETVTTEAMYAAMHIKAVQVQLVLAAPIAANELNLIAAAGVAALARAVQNFGMDIA